jgi:serine protease SohB
MEYLIEYGTFTAKFLTVAVVVVVAIGFLVVFVVNRSGAGSTEHIEVKNLNDRYKSMGLALKAVILPPKAFKQAIKESKKERKARDHAKPDSPRRRRLFVCRFKGDLRASAVASLREEITAILAVAHDEDEVVAVIESPGGTIHGYGLAASQLQRVRDRGIKLTAAVDKVAASGGYMMACVANHIIAAPFAIVGSVGVVAQLPNFHRFLKKHDIDFEQLTAGEYKRTLTMFGENSPEDREKFQQELDDAHELFKEFVLEHRPDIDMETVATGEHWFGRRALDHKLIDELRTSDDYLYAAAADADIFEIEYTRKRGLLDRLAGQAARMLETL